MFKSIFLALLVLLLVGKGTVIYHPRFTPQPKKKTTTTTTTTTTTPNVFSDIHLDLSAYEYDELFLTTKFCNQFQFTDEYERSTQDAECDGEWLNMGIGKVCYPKCKSGYTDQILTAGAGCLEQCSSPWIQVDMICTKPTICNGCVKLCAPWPLENECSNVCTDYPCVQTKTADHYWRDIQITDLCPIGFDTIGDTLDTLMCLSKCGDGYEPGVDILQCVCDATDTLTHLTFIGSFLNDVSDQMSVGLDLLSEILAPTLFGTSANDLYDIFSDSDDALALMNPHLNDITNFLEIFTSTRRRLGWSGEDLVGALEIEVAVHAIGGVSAGIGFAFYNGGVEFYTFWCKGVLTDFEVSISFGITFYNSIDSVAGTSYVVGAGGDNPLAKAGWGIDGYAVLNSLDDPELIGVGIGFGLGAGKFFLELNAHQCIATIHT